MLGCVVVVPVVGVQYETDGDVLVPVLVLLGGTHTDTVGDVPDVVLG